MDFKNIYVNLTPYLTVSYLSLNSTGARFKKKMKV